MKTQSRSRGQDRKRVSSQSHEIGYTAGKLSKKGSKQKAKRAVVKAKKQLGRKTARKTVMSKARQLAA